MTVMLTPYIILDGSAKEAIALYERAFHAEVISLALFGEMPGELPDSIRERIAHARLQIGETILLISDSAGSKINIGNHVTIGIHSSSVEASQHIYDVLRQEGRVNVPLEATSFSPAFANVTDKFGVTFNLMTEVN